MPGRPDDGAGGTASRRATHPAATMTTAILIRRFHHNSAILMPKQYAIPCFPTYRKQHDKA